MSVLRGALLPTALVASGLARVGGGVFVVTVLAVALTGLLLVGRAVWLRPRRTHGRHEA